MPSFDQPNPDHDAAPADSPRSFTPSEGLPQVKAPDTSFLMQLFVYPLAIVCAIAVVVALVHWVSTAGGNPWDEIDALERNNRGRWQAAHNLAMKMASSDQTYKSDSRLAARLAAILDRELNQDYDDYDDKDAKAESIRFRLYLCQALGEFHVDDPLPALLRAAREQVDDDEVAARCTALGAIARLAANLRHSNPIDSPEVIETLLQASREDDAAVVRNAAFALGSLGGPRAVERLKELIAFGNHPSVRYNSAVKLATLGEAASLDVLLEMLDLENDTLIDLDNIDVDGKAEPLDEEKNKDLIEQLRADVRAVVLLNALRAADQLARKNRSVDLGELSEAVAAVAAADLRKQLPRDKADAIHDRAAEVLAALKKNQP